MKMNLLFLYDYKPCLNLCWYQSKADTCETFYKCGRFYQMIDLLVDLTLQICVFSRDIVCVCARHWVDGGNSHFVFTSFYLLFNFLLFSWCLVVMLSF